MKKRVIVSAVLFAFVATPALADWFAGVDTLQQTKTGLGGYSYSSGSGGEFTISETALNISAYVAGVTSGVKGTGPSFQTFCIETGEFVASPIDVVVSTTWTPDATPTIPQWGAAAVSPASHAVKGGMGVGDDLNPETAYLYTKFATATLGGYQYGAGTHLVSGLTRAQSAGELQKAIWYIEGEAGAPAAGSQAKAWYDEAVAAGLTSIGNVRVLNIYAQGTYDGTTGVLKQDQLYLVPVPGAVLLGMLGLSVAGWRLRKFA